MSTLTFLPLAPYGIFVRELIAMDGADTGEIVLIDELGCPTDPTIMTALVKPDNGSATIQTTFEAFKFPTTDQVQFKALVTPCVTACEPVVCPGVKSDFASYGRRRRRRSPSPPTDTIDNNVIVVKTLAIEDNFEFEDKKRSRRPASAIIRGGGRRSEDGAYVDYEVDCVDINAVIQLTCVFLFAQASLVALWAYLKYLRRRQDHSSAAALVTADAMAAAAAHRASMWSGHVNAGYMPSSVPQMGTSQLDLTTNCGGATNNQHRHYAGGKL